MRQRIIIDNTVHELEWLVSTRAGQTLLALLYENKGHPYCNCVSGRGVEMYVGRRGKHFYISRMPGSGMLHSPDCESLEDSNYLTGATAYTHDVMTECDDSRLIINYGKPVTGVHPVQSMSLSAVFDLLIEQANLNRHVHRPGFHKVTWSTTQVRLINAARSILFRNSLVCLADQLVIPPPFDKENPSSEQETFEGLSRTTNDTLVCAPFKEIRKSSYGWLLSLKHLAHFKFWVPNDVAAAAETSSLGHFSLTSPPRFALCLGSLRPGKSAGSFTVSALSVKTTDASFMPCANNRFAEIADQLRAEGTSFVRVLRFDAPNNKPLADYALLNETMTPIFISSPTGNAEVDAARRSLASLFERNNAPARIIR